VEAEYKKMARGRITREARATSMSNPGNETMQLAILIIVAIALLVNSALVVIILVSVGKLGKKITDEIADLRSSVMPMVNDTRDLLTNIGPKVESAADDMSAILHTLRSQTAAFESVSEEVVGRFRRQAERMEVMVSGLIDTADRTSNAVADTIGRPIRRIAGLVASARAAVESLRAPAPTVQAKREQDKRDLLV
jgi:uncharacterized protein YoxC